MKKRLLSISLCLTLIIGLLNLNFVNADTTITSPDVAMLENILNGNRTFVIDTLIGDNSYRTNFSTNPYAIANEMSGGKTLMDEVLDQYCNTKDPNYSPAYSATVAFMQQVYNSSDYIQNAADFVTEHAAEFTEVFNADAAAVIRDLTNSVEELRYESILKEVLASDYTSSDGVTLSTKEIETVNIERIATVAKNINNFSGFFKSFATVNHIGKDYNDSLNFYNDYLLKYYDSSNTVVKAFVNEQTSNDTKAILEFATLCASLYQFEKYESTKNHVNETLTTYGPEFFIQDPWYSLIKDVNGSISTVSKTLSAYSFINSIGVQTTSMKNTLSRMAHGPNSEMNEVIQNFSDLIGEAGTTSVMSYETLMKYIRDTGVITSLAKKGTDKASKFALKTLKDNFGETKTYKQAAIETSSLSTKFAKASNIVGITAWCADKAVGLKNTCKKTFELLYLQELIQQAINTYYDDLDKYNKNKTEQNAKNVLDDLLIIQKMRLRGEAIAYNMIEGQYNSQLGKLLMGGAYQVEDTLKYFKSYYQHRIDAFIGASAMPYTMSPLTINSGETFRIYSESSRLLGDYHKADGTSHKIGEMEYRVASGIIVNQGSTLILSSNNIISIPYIINNGGNVIFRDNFLLTEYTQKSGTTTFYAPQYRIDDFYVNGGSLISDSGTVLNLDNLNIVNTPDIGTISFNTENCDISGTWSMSGQILNVSNSAKVSGTLTGGIVNYKGDSVGGGGTVQTLNVCGNETQNFTGTLNVKDLKYVNKGTVNQRGNIYVSNTVENADSVVTSGYNTVLKNTGQIIGLHYNSGLTIDGVSLTEPMTFNGSLHTQNTVSLNELTINGGLVQKSGTLTLNKDITASSDSYFAGTLTQNETATLYCGGNVEAYGTNSFNKIILNGDAIQHLSGTINVKDFINLNHGGFNTKGTVNVSGTISNDKGKSTGTGMTLLSGGIFTNTEHYDGDITICSNTEIPQEINGSVIIKSDVTLHSDTDFAGDLNIASGKTSIVGSKLTISDTFTNNGELNADEESIITVQKTTDNKGTISGKGLHILKGLVKNSGTMKECSLDLAKDFYNTGTVNITSLKMLKELYNDNSLKTGDLYFNTDAIITLGGKNIDTTNLYLDGTGKIILNSKINVSGDYTNNGITINDDNIVLLQGKIITSDREYKDYTITSDLELDNCTVTVDNLNASAGITLKNGAKLIINKKLKATGTSAKNITIDETSQLTVKKLADIKNYGNIVVDGTLSLKSDTLLTSTKLSGNGEINVYGDLYCSSATINKPNNFNIIGKTPQTITCSNASFNNLTIDNTSQMGVVFKNTVYYYGEYNNSSTVSGTVTKK